MTTYPISHDMLAGRTESHLALLGGQVKLHRDVIEPFGRLQRAAAGAGFDLQVASGFRNYQRQLAIWNAKAEGLRPLLDSQGNPLDSTVLDDREKALAILRWSALPGCSRHHWGSDVDLWDRAAVSADYSLQLVAAEYSPGGPFAPLSCWLENHAGEFGFYRPYDRDRGGVAPEPWHWSYRPVAEHFEAQLSRAFICKVLDNGDLKLREVILANLDEIAARFILPPNRETHA
ncbi:MAG: M15 family metallopeptidase [Porticoccaceae bacterium]